MRSFLHETVLVKCQVCSIPQADQIYWLRHNEKINDLNVNIKTQITSDQCSESILEIVVCCILEDLDNKNRKYFFSSIKSIHEYQFDQYECRGENLLGQRSYFMDLHQSKKKI